MVIQRIDTKKTSRLTGFFIVLLCLFLTAFMHVAVNLFVIPLAEKTQIGCAHQ